MKIINGKQRFVKKLIEIAFTLFLWLIFIFLLMLLLPPFAHFFLIVNTYSFLVFAFVITFISLSIILALTTYWSFYNQKKYGSLNRRKMPKDVTQEELAVAYNISVEEVIRFQHEKWLDVEVGEEE